MAARKGGSRRGATTRKRSAKKPTHSGLPGWLWGVGGLVAGFFLAQYMQDSAPEPLATVLPKTPSPERTATPGESGGSDTETNGGESGEMPTFEFYTLLPESEVVAPGMENVVDTATATADATTDTGSTEDSGDEDASDPIAAELARIADADDGSGDDGDTNQRYMLQAASFRQSSDADGMAGRLRDVGLTTSVNEVQTNDGNTVYRVQVGPYQNDKELNRAQDLMMAQGIEPLMIQVRN
ncbi:SPOR domain-containing protein [Aidingimonas halophila]|uniref:Cell division protein FtsN n=1 Tax=Aidingimonas halophila TaxID=574349 RepID=A0A1H2VEW3_9GAMM|nr:SPOR domain-containing protein [Aidingimonas halophila]GHC24200.1 cell division protein [Aidingimonas halophila]SDW66842.1 Cell division protein FtsN [Aidingimonas halophila]